MKRFIGMLLCFAGGAGALWGGYHVLLGENATRLTITDDFAVSAMTMGLVGVAVFVVGITWARE
jgi:hypothetical protein